jgi:hypothetical protein
VAGKASNSFLQKRTKKLLVFGGWVSRMGAKFLAAAADNSHAKINLFLGLTEKNFIQEEVAQAAAVATGCRRIVLVVDTGLLRHDGISWFGGSRDNWDGPMRGSQKIKSFLVLFCKKELLSLNLAAGGFSYGV